MKISDKHIMFISETEIKQICQPLFDLLDITYFNYMRTYPDGSFSVLTTHATRDKYLFEQDYQDSMDYDPAIYAHSEGYILWNDAEKFLPTQAQKELIRKKIRDGANFFNVGNGIAFYEKHVNFVDIYQFGADSKNENIIASYFIHNNELQLFIAFFKEKARNLIKLSHENKLILPNLEKIERNEKIITNDEMRKNIFLQATKVKRYYVEAGSKAYLTPRELACLAGVARGLKQKEVAHKLKVSPKTIEYFLENIKRKLGLSNIHQLIEAYWLSLLPKNKFYEIDIH